MGVLVRALQSVIIALAMAYTAEDVVRLFEGDGNALNSVIMEGSDDELGFDEVEVVENPYYHHTAEFEDFEELEGIVQVYKCA